MPVCVCKGVYDCLCVYKSMYVCVYVGKESVVCDKVSSDIGILVYSASGAARCQVLVCIVYILVGRKILLV